jgi:hypothetical protein
MVAVENSIVENRIIVVISRLVGQTGPGTQSGRFPGPSREEGLDKVDVVHIQRDHVHLM